MHMIFHFEKRVIYAENNIHGGIKAVEQLLESDRPTAIFAPPIRWQSAFLERYLMPA